MMDAQKLYPVAEKIVRIVEYMLVEEMGLMPPERYEVVERDSRLYMTASFNPMALGRSLKGYENPDVARRLQTALGGIPVAITQKTGTHYVILLSGKLSLPKSIDFPGFGKPDVFRLGVGLHGEITLHANQMKNVIIGAGQGAGKSNIQTLLVHQARAFGWKLYLADPDGHTYNPDVWNGIAAAPVASSPQDMLLVLERIFEEIADRVALYRRAAQGSIPPEDIDAYNKVAAEQLPRLLLSIDEANSYLGDRKIFTQLADLLRRGRKWGLHVALSGHEWHKNTVPAEVNDMLQTRIGLATATEQTSMTVLKSSRWGRWVMGKPAGRGILRTGKYQPMQFYLISDEMEREWLGRQPVLLPVPNDEVEYVRRAMDESDGKMTIELLIGWGMNEWAASSLLERYETRGWLEKDPGQKNARYITPKLADLLSNTQTSQTASNTHLWSQTGSNWSQTPDMAGA